MDNIKMKPEWNTQITQKNLTEAEKRAFVKKLQTAKEEGALTVYLQPQFAPAGNHVCSAEALIRWKKPGEEIRIPADFLPVAEAAECMVSIDEFVFEKTCGILQKWERDGRRPCPIQVNLSGATLNTPGICDRFLRLTQQYGVNPLLLQLEIPESVYLSNPSITEQALNEFHKAGFFLVIDNVWQHYGALNLVKKIQADSLKVDMRSLPVGKETTHGETAIAGMVRMANLSGLTVGAQGVESRQQRDFLEGIGCRSIQGFYDGVPIPADEFEEKYLPRAEKPLSGAFRFEYVSANTIRDTMKNTDRKQLLVIDDSKTDGEILVRLLSEYYDIHVCESGEAGLAYLRQHVGNVALILLDNIMPGMSGLDFLRFCNEETPLRCIPKIMITADENAVAQVQAFRQGAYDYITKPFVREVLLARIRHAFDVCDRMALCDYAEEAAVNAAEYDPATELLAKVSFQNLTAKILHQDPLGNALFVVDIDNFKTVNDRFGHLTGDRVIRCVAEELRRSFRKTDIVGRFGGDEFVVLMTKISNRDNARRKAEDIIKAVLYACPNQAGVGASVSVGIAFSEAGDSYSALFSRADQALYEAKNTGKGKSVVYGDQVPSVEDDDRPVVLICSENPQIYPAVALAYGDGAGFVNVTGYQILKDAFRQYGSRISTVCLDMERKVLADSDDFYRFITEHGGGDTIPILIFYQDGNIDQIREALNLKITDLLALPPQIDSIRTKLSAAIMKAEMKNGKRATSPECRTILEKPKMNRGTLEL